MDVVIMPIITADLRTAYFGGGGGWKRKTLEILLCGALMLTFASALEYVGWPKSPSVAIGDRVELIGVDAIRGATMRIIGNKFDAYKEQLMQILNSQHKAFLDMVAWSEGIDNGRQKTRNHGYDVTVDGELLTGYSDHPRKLVMLNPRPKSTAAGRYQLLSRQWDACRKQLGLKDFSSESQDAVVLQQIKKHGALPMIDCGDIRRVIDRCSNIWTSLPGAGYGRFEYKADSLTAKFKEAGETVRGIEV